MEIILNKEVARKVLKVVDKGLIGGLGSPKPGDMCVEAAVCYALDLPHGDNPPCVGSKVRDFKIALNDSYWPTNKDRTQGMRKLAIAQLGSNELNQDIFLEKVGFRCMTTVLPVILENALKEDKDNEFVKARINPQEIKDVIKALKSAKTFDQAKAAAKKARDIYYAYAHASAYASASASAYASAYASASASAYASAYASASASAYAKKNKTFSLKVLNLISKACLDTLIEMKSPGCKWLSLCK
jgi:hypothetical protein